MEKPIQTQAEARREASDRLKACICEYLQCTSEQYSQLQYVEGMKYLKTYINDHRTADKLSASRVFWAWWRNHWTNRDEAFLCLTRQTTVKNREIRVQLYLQYNDGKKLAGSIHPNSVVLKDSYDSMVKELMTDDNDKTITL